MLYLNMNNKTNRHYDSIQELMMLRKEGRKEQMQHELPILINITVALLAAFIGGLLARRLKMPSMVGYMLAGVVIGPFTPGFSGDLSTIQQLAELGVIFLL